MLSVKATAAGSIIAGGLALAAVGMAPVANAAPSTPVIAGPQWLANNGPGHGHRHDAPLITVPDDHGHGHDDWGWDGPRGWDPIDACVSAQGPFGYVQGSVCI